MRNYLTKKMRQAHPVFLKKLTRRRKKIMIAILSHLQNDKKVIMKN